MEDDDDVRILKTRLQQKLGNAIPVSDMKIRLGGYNQFVMIDTASNIRVGTSGVTVGARLGQEDSSVTTIETQPARWRDVAPYPSGRGYTDTSCACSRATGQVGPSRSGELPVEGATSCCTAWQAWGC